MQYTQLLLASQSPRRRAMITWLGLTVQIVSSDIDERPKKAETPRSMATRLALAKARAVKIDNQGAWVLAADTIVDLVNRPLGKPKDRAEARSILWQLRQQHHNVHSGIALYNPSSGESIVRRVTTEVEMRDYTPAEIEAYVASGDPMDKAGAYAIQNAGFHPVTRVDRCYANVVGFPLCAVASLLQEWNVTLSVTIPELCANHFGYNCPLIDEGIRL